MYKIIGTDGKEYGPADAGHVRQWIRQHRVEARTPVFVTGSPEWTYLGLLPEFAADLPMSAPPPLTGSGPAVIVPGTPPPSSSLATAGLVCGGLSITLCCCCGGLPFNLLGLVFSVIALVQISEQPGRYGGRDQAILGLIFSILGLMLTGLVLISR